MANEQNLIPAKKGEIRNPKGYPKGIPNSKTRYLRLLTLTEKIKNPVTGELEEFSVIEQLDMQLIAKARKGDLGAYKEIMDRLEGKAPNSLDITTLGKELPVPILGGISVQPNDSPKEDNQPPQTD